VNQLKPGPLARCVRCGAAHRYWPKLLNCLRPGLSLEGNGPFVALGCGRAALSFDDGKAAEAVARWNREGCGAGCTGRHEAVDLRKAR